jgi:hypothetical protein
VLAAWLATATEPDFSSARVGVPFEAVGKSHLSGGYTLVTTSCECAIPHCYERLTSAPGLEARTLEG